MIDAGHGYICCLNRDMMGTRVLPRAEARREFADTDDR
jgi:hypothetical protein